MKRRAFLQTTSTITLPIILNGLNLTAITQSKLFNMINGDNDRVLVLINLIGGNDGLNTLIPLDNYGVLASVRSNIIIPQNNILKIEDKNGFHPSMEGFQELFMDGKLNIVQNVGYPDQNRSHFRSSDIWTTASDSDEFLTTGWLGRFFDNRFPNFPDDYPNDDNPDPVAMTMGYIVSETCQGAKANFSSAINDPEDLTPLQETEETEVPNTCYGRELTFVRNAIRQTNAYTASILKAVELGQNLSNKYKEDSELAQQLKVIAKLISGGLRTKIYVASIGGFDTHANQVSPNGVLNGQHADLLSDLSEAVCAFQDDMKLQGLEERVVGMTYSEFGRRIRSNFSNGTDHGTAAPLFVFGSCVNSAVIGDNPEINNNVGVEEGIPMQYDFRSVYGSILMDWFGAEEDEVKSLLFNDFKRIPIIMGCQSTPTVEEDLVESLNIKFYPNPFDQYTQLELELPNSMHIKISLFNALGSELRVITNRKLDQGVHNITIEGYDLSPGNYFVRILSDTFQKTKLIQKI